MKLKLVLLIIFSLTALTVAVSKAQAVTEGCTIERLTGGICTKDPDVQVVVNDEQCGQTSPAGYGCCCTKAAMDKINEPYTKGTTQNKQILPSILKVPDLRVTIPGMDKLQPVTCDSTGCSVPWLAQYIGGLQRYAIGVMGILAVIVMMLGGLIWLTAGGNQTKISDAKKFISGGLLGIVLTMGAYMLLYIINPDLTVLKSLNIKYIEKIDLAELMAEIKNGAPISQDAAALMNALDKDGIIQHTVGKSADTYKALSCDKSIFSGGKSIEFFTTGYYKPPYENSQKFFCDIGLQCSCPSGISQIGPNRAVCKHNYKYCSSFSSTTPYCTSTASGKTPAVGMIAADTCFSFGDQVCIGGKITLTVEDRGSAIKGRRFDIFSAMDQKSAFSKTGVVSVTLGPCQ